MDLFTLGYEGFDVDEYFRLLVVNGVEHIVDVREVPLSRKPGFSKKSLINYSERFGIQYTHLVQLGCPRVIRHDFQTDGNWFKYSERFIEYLLTQRPAIEELSAIVARQKVSLLCVEANPYRCHRSIVADKLLCDMGKDLSINHLSASPKISTRAVWLQAA